MSSLDVLCCESSTHDTREAPMSRVDVIIPCYKYGHFLHNCVRSVLSQEGVQVRVLIIDDASPDHTEQVGSELAADNPCVEFRKHQVNQGHIATYNEGLDWATGDYTLLLSADDLLTPGALGRAARLMDTHPEVGFTYGRAIKTSHPEQETITPPGDCACQIIPGHEFLRACCATGENVVDTPTAVVRTSVQKKVGGYRKELPHAGDMEMWLRFAAHAAVGFVGADQAYYRLHGQNMSVQYRHVRDFIQRKAVFDSLFREPNDHIPGGRQLQRLADRALAEHALWTATRVFEGEEPWECGAYLAFAVSLWPSLRHSRPWCFLRLKRLLGARGWSLVRPFVRHWRWRLAASPDVAA
jgi:glycosyltransferase involved in cell wall biosynthesis